MPVIIPNFTIASMNTKHTKDYPIFFHNPFLLIWNIRTSIAILCALGLAREYAIDLGKTVA
jgi:hypothetical protein